MTNALLPVLLAAKLVWMDVDPAVLPGGHEPDDGLALLQAFHSPELDVRGVSVVFGNSELEVGYPNAREIVNRVQRLRRDSGLEITDRIELGVFGDPEVVRAGEVYRDFICGEVLALDAELGEEGPSNEAYEASEKVELDGRAATVALRRRSGG